MIQMDLIDKQWHLVVSRAKKVSTLCTKMTETGKTFKLKERDNKKRFKRAMVASIRGRHSASGMHIWGWPENKLEPIL